VARSPNCKSATAFSACTGVTPCGSRPHYARLGHGVTRHSGTVSEGEEELYGCAGAVRAGARERSKVRRRTFVHTFPRSSSLTRARPAAQSRGFGGRSAAPTPAPYGASHRFGERIPPVRLCWRGHPNRAHQSHSADCRRSSEAGFQATRQISCVNRRSGMSRLNGSLVGRKSKLSLFRWWAKLSKSDIFQETVLGSQP
jgi:hypothetical protein